MDGTFTTLLRDVVVILAAAAIVVAAAFGAGVAWRLYRLGRQLYDDLQPILDSVHGTSETVRSTAQFMETRMHERAGAALAIVHTSRTLTVLVRDFYKGIPPSARATTPMATDEAGAGSAAVVGTTAADDAGPAPPMDSTPPTALARDGEAADGARQTAGTAAVPRHG